MGNVFEAGISNDWHEVSAWIIIEKKLGKIGGQFYLTAFSECMLF
jgi:hypothetical protein